MKHVEVGKVPKRWILKVNYYWRLPMHMASSYSALSRISCPAACASYYFSLLPCHSQLNALPPPVFHSQLSALFQSPLKHVLDPSLDTLNSNDDDDECMFSSCVGYNY
ncbi:unnamed protein product [Prunus armeniaca]|uniref:Uncharacterized protein n=1 Tax=Prunus armeniaca TaxID=36596 RepID=A0A6J5WCW7_PRUAR|nr:unnamed protein product [Prunus armeniaca]